MVADQNKSDINKVAVMGTKPGCEVKYREPCPAAMPGGTPTEDVTHTDLVKKIIEQHGIFQSILEKLTTLITSLGTITKPQEAYYDTPLTAIQVATPNQPNSPDTISNAAAVPPAPGYQLEYVYPTLQRISPKITVINDGSDTLFVISTPDGKNWSSEVTILTGEARTLWNVWALALRSPTAGIVTPPSGGVYRVIERDFWLAYSKPAGGTANRPAFDAQVVNAPLAGAFLPNIPVPNGFSLVVRANVNNAAAEQIFIGNSIVNATTAGVPGNRDTLNAGDRAALFVTNANLVAVASTTGVGNVDILVEQ